MAGDVIEIRRATERDLDKVFDLLSSAKLPVDGVSESFERFFVAETSGTIVGSAGIEKHGEYGLLRSAAVSEALRGRGVGRRLINEVIADARQNRLRALYLLTTTAETYFPEFGFERVDRAAVPPEVNESVEFQGVCCASAAVMRLNLQP